MIAKADMDKLVERYEVKSFLDNDPSQFLRKYKNEYDIEIASFITALFSFGKREAFISKLNDIFNIMGNSPYKFLLNFKGNEFKGFKYRFIKENDLVDLLFCLKKLYTNNSLKKLFYEGYKKFATIKDMLIFVVEYFYSNSQNPASRGFKHLLSNPKKGSAMKRLCLFLRWMIRDGEVDIGLWDFIPKSELIIPLDTHVIQQTKKMGLLKTPKADFKTAVELTNILKTFDKNDPVKYDFALFGYGIEND